MKIPAPMTMFAVQSTLILVVMGLACDDKPATTPATDSDATVRDATDQSEIREQLMVLAPTTTRAGFPRFGQAITHQPLAAEVFLLRYAAEPDPLVRHALIEALPRTNGEWAEMVVEAFGQEVDVRVRRGMALAFRHAPATQGHAGLRAAMTDGDPTVRAAAAEAVGLRDDGTALEAELIAALDDAQPMVQAAAVRSLGVLDGQRATDAIAALLEHTDVDVQLQALHALRRLDPQRAAQSSALARLTNSSDARIQAAAAELGRSR